MCAVGVQRQKKKKRTLSFLVMFSLYSTSHPLINECAAAFILLLFDASRNHLRV